MTPELAEALARWNAATNEMIERGWAPAAAAIGLAQAYRAAVEAEPEARFRVGDEASLHGCGVTIVNGPYWVVRWRDGKHSYVTNAELRPDSPITKERKP